MFNPTMTRTPSPALTGMPTQSAAARLLADIRSGSPILFRNAAILLVLGAACVALTFVDARSFQGVNVWHKPAKFFVSLAVQLATVSWAMSLLPGLARATRTIKACVYAMIGAAWLELIYLSVRASRAEGSHFNTATPLDGALYTLMGIGAVTLTVTAAIIGLKLWKERRGNLRAEAASLGLVVGAILGTVVGAYLSSQPSHWIGGQMTDANGLSLFKWSTTGGDLRVAHFIGLHAAQFIPFAALTGNRRAVYATAAATIILTALAFWQAVAGMPLIKV